MYVRVCVCMYVQALWLHACGGQLNPLYTELLAKPNSWQRSQGGGQLYVDETQVRLHTLERYMYEGYLRILPVLKKSR